MMLHEPTISVLIDLWRNRAATRDVAASRDLETVAIELEHAIGDAEYEAELMLARWAKELDFRDPVRICARCDEPVYTPSGLLCADCISRVRKAAAMAQWRKQRKKPLTGVA